VDEQDFRTRRVTPFLRGDGQTVGRLHGDRLILQVLPEARLRYRGQQSGRDRHFDEATIANGYRHRNLPFVFLL